MAVVYVQLALPFSANSDQKQGEVWQEKVVPGMKKAILCSLLCTQEFIEGRKVRVTGHVTVNYIYIQPISMCKSV